MREASSRIAARQFVQHQPKSLLRRHLRRRLEGELLRNVDHRRGETAAAFLIERRCRQKCFEFGRRLRQAFELFPFMSGTNILCAAPLLHLRHRHQAGVVVLVALHRQADALDGVGDEADGPVVIDRLEGFDHAGHVVSAQIGHQLQQFVVAAAVDQLRHLSLIADVVPQMLAEGSAALEAQRRIHLVRAIIDPAPQSFAAGLGKRRLHQAAVFDDHDLPAEIAEHGLRTSPTALPAPRHRGSVGCSR